ncbi:S2-RNase [Pyrus ussuriensis x Pyrus communis]|uniref:S2-RNase n=1 Tax=Pyrus ussuriensis x Pyrus communis TaxID=2448454 RepID=A0A5N5FZM7_9ROSA|nr:S2-RNase [Pyrus ussuriensis x Pyrus communis]
MSSTSQSKKTKKTKSPRKTSLLRHHNSRMGASQVKLGMRPIKQTQRCYRSKLIPQIEAEIDKQIKPGFIRKVEYPKWISNIIIVLKKSGQIRVCVDFHDLNDACPKDEFLLPIIEIMVDATTSHKALSFMDGSSGYNQIHMAPEDEELTTFRTPKGVYYYKVMSFGLKNVGVTYQCSMQKIFNNMLHENIECYVDDVVVKTKKSSDHLKDLQMVFDKLQHYNLKRNPLKSAFGVTSRKFLGFIIKHRGIEVDQLKIKAIQSMPKPRNIHKLKSLQGRLTFIRRFISNLTGHCQLFSRLMKNDTSLIWDDRCHNAFESIKRYLASPLILGAPMPRKPLIIYIATQEGSIGALLVQENDNQKEIALYNLSRTLIGEEEADQAMEEAHIDVSGAHQSGPKLHFQLKRMGYYWSSMVKDCLYEIECQNNATTYLGCGASLASVQLEFKTIEKVFTKAQQLRFKALELVLKKVLNQTDAAEFLVAFEGIQEASHQFAVNQSCSVTRKSNPPLLRMAIQEGLTKEENEKLQLQELEALDERKLKAQQHLECYQARLSKAFNKKVCPRSFQTGDLVLALRRPIIITHKTKSKFTSKWDGPYVIQEVYTNNAYLIMAEDGLKIDPINGKFLKYYYP